MLLSELINTQWDDLIALSLAIVIIPCHMFWCLGSPTANWKHRKQARSRRLPLSTKLKHFAQLQLLYLYLFLLFLISMYSCSATLQARRTALAHAPHTPTHRTRKPTTACPARVGGMRRGRGRLTRLALCRAGLRIARGLPHDGQVARRVHRPPLSRRM